MGMGLYGCMATLVVPDKEFTWNVPEHWTLEEAATIPVVYGTVSFYTSCSIYPADKVLTVLCVQAQ
jgi:NADPH:quinone reductase-like Zn-dependent oxidoreductase